MKNEMLGKQNILVDNFNDLNRRFDRIFSDFIKINPTWQKNLEKELNSIAKLAQFWGGKSCLLMKQLGEESLTK